MNTAYPQAGEAVLDLPVSREENHVAVQEQVQYFGSQQDYKKTKKYLIWFSVSALVIFISTSIFVF